MLLRDIELNTVPPIGAETSLRRAWQIMRDESVTTLCVEHADGTLAGMVTLKDVSAAVLDGQDAHVLANTRTLYSNVVSALDGAIISGDPVGKAVEGRIVVGAGSAEQMERAIHAGDIVVVSSRSEGQLTALEADAGCLVVCTGVEVSKGILRVAREKGCLIVSTPHNVYATAQILPQAVPVRCCMRSEELLTFTLDTPLDEAARTIRAVRHRYFPVLDGDGRCAGMLSHRNLLSQFR
ncbi:MAG: CBS domain-containing protein [Oscillospiraceae bacterium]|nr:CBS domain-containing protein [Oscillospiraceae bacterium]